jgi:hypothetical protein
MQRHRITAGIGLLALMSIQSGCLVTHVNRSIVRANEPRRDMQFESPFAQRTFNQLAFNEKRRNDSVSARMVAIPFLTMHVHTATPSENAFYNDQIAVCDTDGDGFITDSEAMSYHERMGADDSIESEVGEATAVAVGKAVDLK